MFKFLVITSFLMFSGYSFANDFSIFKKNEKMSLEYKVDNKIENKIDVTAIYYNLDNKYNEHHILHKEIYVNTFDCSNNSAKTNKIEFYSYNGGLMKTEEYNVNEWSKPKGKLKKDFFKHICENYNV